eukprot:CAMPEP_0118946040 /NCGR_PEP_ID=MMETSP1169-20130426/43479_1 /TAXON_ID=36882 /ORGANISM="Pyramimonas obovata, Strain CCMP722" /LENGTH=445 /DNA_ID=CAMNT_0006891919 /DNA_START=1 /DNA_END=1338 /DNA_ORIENTATION=+
MMMLGTMPALSQRARSCAGSAAVNKRASAATSRKHILVSRCLKGDVESDGGKSNAKQRAASTALAIALATLEIATPVVPLLTPPPAQAVLSAPNANIPRSVDAALRRSIPVVNQDTKAIQDKMEDTAFLLRIPQRKPYGNMTVNTEKALAILQENRDALIATCPEVDRATAIEIVDTLEKQLGKLVISIETRDPDRVGFRVADVLKSLSALEMLQAPGLPYSLPAQYADLPKLTGRATVEFDIQKAGGSTGEFVSKLGGGGSKSARVQLVLDGYSAPLTAGHFAQLVQERYYDGAKVLNGESSLYVGGEQSTTKKTPASKLPLPLELMPADSFEPQYRLPLDVGGGEYPVLPLSLYGSAAMVHGDSFDSDPSKFFFYLFDKSQSGLGGLSFDEGNFAVFGYVTEGKEILSQIRNGDVIQSARIVSGADKLIAGSRTLPDELLDEA